MPAILEDYVSQAEKVIAGLPRKKDRDRRPTDEFELTTTQLRGILSLTAQLYDEAEGHVGETLPASLMEKVQYLRVRLVYQAGREQSVKAFVEQAHLLEALKEVGESRDKLLRFCRYLEALVAYKKFLDPKDK